MRRYRWAFLIGLFPALSSGGDTGWVTQDVYASIYPIAKLTAPSSVSLSPGVNPFTPFQASVPISFRARTTGVGGGNITVQVTSDFLPAGGPSVSAGGLTYTCGGTTLGTPCSTAQTASTTTQTPVLALPPSTCTGGGGACSSQDPNTVTVNFTLTDDPGYATGAYSARITFTISAT